MRQLPIYTVPVETDTRTEPRNAFLYYPLFVKATTYEERRAESDLGTKSAYGNI
jgi:hypothetical protein